MIRQSFNVKHYWKVIVYYNIDYNFFDLVEADLDNISSPVKERIKVFTLLNQHKAKGVTISSLKYNTSIVLISRHHSIEDFISTIVHEAEHIKQAMLDKYNVEDKDEPPAYTIGYLVMKMFKAWRYLI